MKKIKNIFSSVLLIAMLTFSLVACESEDDDAGGCNGELLADLSEKVSTTALTFVENQTSGNCIAYKNALEAFINAADDCPEVEDEVERLRGFLNQLDCNN